MKSIKLLLISVAATMAISASASDYVFKAGNDSVDTQICMFVAQDDLQNYKWKAQRAFGGTRIDRHQFVANKIHCNDQPIVKFANKYQSLKTAIFISGYLNRSIIIRRDEEQTSIPLNQEQSKVSKVVIVTAN